MRYFCCFIVTLSAYLLNAEEPYLYRTDVKVSNTIVLSGPGEHFYPVSQLQYGDKIEVYYERDGYLAVRPPVGSYSWVSAKYVQIDTNNTGTVITDGLASIIGSSLTEDCSTVQVRLKRGEKVFVLDRRETPENADSPLWLKIAPPSGEFRWIAKSSITGKSGTADKTQESSGVRQVRYDQIDDAFPAVNKGNTNTQTPLPLSKPAAETNKEPAPASLGEAKVASNRRLPLDGVSD
ncbi:MAG: SH3 domain-containing protein, partial [Planctomycetaceae bacterium]|nr:SH3 domain-containing protein [Planctomycetaceae bacterium]